MNKDILKELPLIQKYIDGSESKSVIDLSGSDSIDIKNNDSLKNEFLIYLNVAKPKILLRVRGSKSMASKFESLPDFKEVLRQLPELSFDSILFTLSLYGVISNKNPLDIIKQSKKFKSIPLIDEILKPTYGFVLYAHQFEQIYSRIPSSSDLEIITLRKDWNKKKPEAIEIVKQTEIIKGFSFYDLLMERTVEENHFVWNANFKGAKLLWEYLNKKVKSEK